MANWVTSDEATKQLNITLNKLIYWRDRGWITTKKINNRKYLFDLDSVSKRDNSLVSNSLNVIYARIPNNGTKADLIQQISEIKSYTSGKGINIDKMFIEVGSGLGSDRPEFNKLLNLIFTRKINTVYLYRSDRLVRFSFNILDSIFHYFGARIELLKNDDFEDETFVQELFEDWSRLLDNYCLKTVGEDAEIFKQMKKVIDQKLT